MQRLTLPKPDDWHTHLRDNAALTHTVPTTAESFSRALVMPNLKQPVTTLSLAMAYKERILNALPPAHAFEPLMTLYLTQNTTPQIIEDAKKSGIVFGVKWYPKGATTLSEFGVATLAGLESTLAAMQAVGMPLLIHGEVVDDAVDIFDREAVFIEEHLRPLLKKYPKLKVVFEHITTQDAVSFVQDGPDTLAATVTAHHLWINRNHLLAGGIKPHYYCLPVAKRYTHQQALIQAVTSGNPKFFLGTDSAPHAIHQKESACGCAGIYTAPFALSYYVQIFESAGALEHFEAFACRNGPGFYGVKTNATSITLIKKPITVPSTLALGQETVVPFLAGQTLDWQLEVQA
jgi:dihydroorotase